MVLVITGEKAEGLIQEKGEQNGVVQERMPRPEMMMQEQRVGIQEEEEGIGTGQALEAFAV